MKKIIIIFTIFILGLNSMAQDSLLVNKNGNFILPQKGDIGVGLSATPFLNYFGNIFNGNTNNALNLNDQQLYFRYFLSQNSAVRLTLRVNSTNNVSNYYVSDDAAKALDPLSLLQVNDRLTANTSIYQVRVGYEKFRGYKRLRGFYGADIGYSYSDSKGKYEYGNQMVVLNPNPTTAWGNQSSRVLEYNNGASNTISLGAFTGAEYYFMSKISLGAELGVIFGTSWNSQSYSKGERMVLSLHTNYDQALSPGNTSTSITTAFPYSYGNLYLIFHF